MHSRFDAKDGLRRGISARARPIDTANRAKTAHVGLGQRTGNGGKRDIDAVLDALPGPIFDFLIIGGLCSDHNG